MFDLKQRDSISYSDAVRCLTALGLTISDEKQLSNLITEVHKEGTASGCLGKNVTHVHDKCHITRESFLLVATTLSSRNSLAEQALTGFLALDVRGNGLLHASDLERINASLGHILTSHQIMEIMRYCDHDKDGVLSWGDLSKAMINLWTTPSSESLSPLTVPQSVLDNSGKKEEHLRSSRRAIYENMQRSHTQRTQNAAYFAKMVVESREVDS